MTSTLTEQAIHWTPGNYSRVPYAVFQRPDVLQAEQARVFEGPVWNFLCLETDLPKPGDYRTTFVGAMPVVVARDEDGEIDAFENRCAHRGALICLDDCGMRRKHFQCVYHAWRYDLRGNLRRHRVRAGRQRQGRHARRLRKDEHGPRKLRITTFCGLVFGTLSPDAPPHRGLPRPRGLRPRLRRVCTSRLEIIGRFTQALPNNWKLYLRERARHLPRQPAAHVLRHLPHHPPHSGRRRAGQRDGGHHASYTSRRREGAETAAYQEQALRSDKESFRLGRSRACWHASTSSATTSSCRSYRLPRLRPAADAQLRSRCARSCPRRRRDRPHWTYLGFADDTPELRAHAAEAEQPGRAGRLRLDGGRRRRRLRAARHRRRRATSSRWWRWAAPARRRRRRARPRPRCAASGRPTARTWDL